MRGRGATAATKTTKWSPATVATFCHPRGVREEMQIAGMGFAKRRDSSTAATFCPAGRMRQALPAAISPPFRIKDTCRRRKRRLSHCRRRCAGRHERNSALQVLCGSGDIDLAFLQAQGKRSILA